ncbi:hypothetical protein MGMO_191c00030 [Methyloglobulus morosus KoM1]|uniref:Uncharacterized protein n=1 Tax=Methyloglobulus morosus KoM1 TaxID=1116472 RepID=V5BFD5_9GAMM|nr:hypothetical protein [Methyloglobulus morosus]ESS66469.1 hypothetical protein MGMO_191c00030 [Methyloglobulus morosus KoM1]
MPQNLCYDPLLRDAIYHIKHRILLGRIFNASYQVALTSDNLAITGVNMFNFKSKKMLLTLFFCVLAALIVPTMAQAELGGSGSTAARDVAAQRAEKERKLEKKKHEAEAKKAAGAQQGQPAETQTMEQKKEPAAK